MNTKQFDQMLKQAKQQWETDDAKIEPLREVHRESLEQLAALQSESEQLKQSIESFEGDLESTVTAAEFEAALIRQRSMVVLIRRAEAEEKQASGAWQQAEKNRHNNAHRALGTFQRGFDKEAAGLRAEYSKKFQALL